MAAASRPGAMSLLDKYASINTSIEDTRRRVASAQSNLERANEKIHTLREERNGMLVETEAARLEKARIEADLNEGRKGHRARLAEEERARREHRVAKSEHDGTRRRIDDERVEFLERCREFRASCKRMRVAASILVLDGGGNVDAKDASDEADLWRRLQEEDFSEDEDDRDDATDGDVTERPNKRKRKKADPELDLAEKDEKESREALIEAECALHAERMKSSEATKKSNARTQRLAQQRAQLQRHRKEVEDLELEIKQVKDDIVQENQLANAFEKECNKRKQLRNANSNASYNNNFNPPPQESRSGNNPYNTHNNGSYSNNFNPPPEEQRYADYSNNFSDPPPEQPRSSNYPYNTQNRANYNRYNNNQNNHRTPQPPPSSGYQQRPRGAVTNPYSKTGRTSSAPTPPRTSVNSRQRGQSGRVGNTPTYASDVLYGATPGSGRGQRNGPEQPPTQHPHRGRHVRNQRQFGTSVGVSLDSGMTDELRECMAGFSSDAPEKSGRADDNVSDISSSSSDDEELFSFSVFGKK